MAIASQYVRGAAVPVYLPPVMCGVMSVTKGFLPEEIREEVMVSTTPTATETISESVTVTVT